MLPFPWLCMRVGVEALFSYDNVIVKSCEQNRLIGLVAKQLVTI